MKYLFVLLLFCSFVFAEEPVEIIVPAQEILDALPLPAPEFSDPMEYRKWAKEQSKVYEGRKVFFKARVYYVRKDLNLACIHRFDYIHIRRNGKDAQLFAITIPEQYQGQIEKGDYIEITGTIENCGVAYFRKTEQDEPKIEWTLSLKDWHISKVIKKEKK